MTHNRTGMVLVDPWLCSACGCLNYPNADRCWNCNADTDGEKPEPECPCDAEKTADPLCRAAGMCARGPNA